MTTDVQEGKLASIITDFFEMGSKGVHEGLMTLLSRYAASEDFENCADIYKENLVFDVMRLADFLRKLEIAHLTKEK